MCVWRILRLAIYLLVVMVTLASAREFIDKRSPEDRQSWFMGSRYGRSSGGAGGGGGGATRRLVVTPRRDDRFHPGSRYGKRASEPPSFLDLGTTDSDATRDVQCSYTGVADLYRCHVQSRKENISGEFMANE